MASRKHLVQSDYISVSGLSAPITGFVAFGAKTDGLYLKKGTAPEEKILTEVFPTDINRYGFLNQTETTISFDPTTKIFTLGSVGATWSYYRSGIKYTITGSKTIDLTTVDPALINGAKYFIVIDSTDGTLSASRTVWTLLDTQLPVAIIAWNDTLTPKYFLQEERHSCLIDRREHYYLHTTRGTQYLSGGELLGYTIATTTNAANTFSMGQTVIIDEDIIETLPLKADGNGADPTNYTILYRNPIGTYVWAYSDMPFSYTTNGYINWDNNGTLTQGTGGAGSSVRYYNTYLICTNTQGDGRFVIVTGQNQYTTLQGAYDEIFANLDLQGFPKTEWLALYQLTWVTGLVSLTNKGKVYLARAPERITTSAITVSQTSPVPHNSLSGLQGGSTILDEFFHLTSTQLATYQAQVPIVHAASHHLSTGLLTGGALSINADNTKFDISAGEGYVVDGHTDPEYPTVTEVIWTSKVGIVVTNLNTQIVTYVSLDKNGGVIQSPSAPDATSRRNYIYLGTIVHSNLTTINTVNNQPTIVLELGAQVQDLMNSLGFRSTSGNKIRPADANLQIKKDVGTAFKPGANFQTLNTQPHEFTLPAQNPVTFRYRTQTGVEGTDTTNINPTIYDLNGTITTVPQPNNATIQRVYIFPSGLIRIQPGQMVFATLTEAINTIGNEDFVMETNIAQNALYLGSIAVIKAATNLSLNTEAIFIPAAGMSTAGSVSNLTNLQQAFDISTIPQIITGTGTHQSLVVRRGSAADTDTVFAVQNGAGSYTSGITGDGYYTAQVGYNIDPVDNPTIYTLQLQAGAGLNVGVYEYWVNFYTATGETSYKNISITTTAGNQQVLITLPISSDPRVIGRKIRRSYVNTYSEGAIATIANNTTTTYLDSTPDASMTGPFNIAERHNTTSKFITVNGTQSMVVDSMLTTFGFGAGEFVPGGHPFGVSSTFIGAYAGQNSANNGNVAVGHAAMKNAGAFFNVAVGTQAMENAGSAYYTTFMGHGAGYLATGVQNAGVGFASGTYSAGNGNAYLGCYSGYEVRSGSYNVFIGYGAGYTNQVTTVNNSIGIGANVFTTKSNQVVLGDTNITETILRANVGIGITPTAYLHIKSSTVGTAPLKFTSGPLLTSAEVGAIEFLNDAYYGTITTGAVRKQFAFKTDIVASTFTYKNELMTGVVNGTNKVFTTSVPFVTGSLIVYVNGLKVRNYIVNSSTQITFDDAPLSTGTLDIVEATYVAI